MTPLLPSPQHYLYNLITMTSPDAKRLWRKAIRKNLIVNVYIAETTMNLQNLHSIMSKLRQTVAKALQVIWSLPVERVTKAKVAVIGSNGCVKHLDVTLLESNLY